MLVVVVGWYLGRPWCANYQGCPPPATRSLFFLWWYGRCGTPRAQTLSC